MCHFSYFSWFDMKIISALRKDTGKLLISQFSGTLCKLRMNSNLQCFLDLQYYYLRNLSFFSEWVQPFFLWESLCSSTIVIQFRQRTSINCSHSYSSTLTTSIFYSISSLTVLSLSLCSHQRYPFCITVWTDPVPIFSLTEISRTQENGAHQGSGNGLSIFSRNWMLPSC